MKSKRDIWQELHDLPRDEQQQRRSFEQITNRKHQRNWKIPIVVVAACLILLILVQTTRPERTITAAEGQALQAVYMKTSDTLQIEYVKPSKWYSNTVEITDPAIINGLQFIKENGVKPESLDMNLMKETEYVSIKVNDEDEKSVSLFDLTFVYADGTEQSYKFADHVFLLFNSGTEEKYYMKFANSGELLAFNEAFFDYRYSFKPGWPGFMIILVYHLINAILAKKYKLTQGELLNGKGWKKPNWLALLLGAGYLFFIVFNDISVHIALTIGYFVIAVVFMEWLMHKWQVQRASRLALYNFFICCFALVFMLYI